MRKVFVRYPKRLEHLVMELVFMGVDCSDLLEKMRMGSSVREIFSVAVLRFLLRNRRRGYDLGRDKREDIFVRVEDDLRVIGLKIGKVKWITLLDDKPQGRIVADADGGGWVLDVGILETLLALEKDKPDFERKVEAFHDIVNILVELLLKGGETYDRVV